MCKRVISPLKLTLSIIILSVISIVIVPTIKEWRLIIPQFQHGHMEWIAAAVLCQLFVYIFLSLILCAGLYIYNARLPIPYLIYTSFVFLFANRAMPGPALAGLASCMFLLRKRNIKGDIGQAVAGCFYIADYASFLILAIISFACIHNALQYRTIIWSAGIFILSVIFICLYVIKSQDRLIGFLLKMVNIFGMISKHRFIVHEQNFQDKIVGIVHGIYKRWRNLIKDRKAISLIVLLGLFMHGCEIMTIVCLAYSLGVHINPFAASCSYIIANLSAIVSVLPGGLGVFEAGMAVTLHNLGHLPYSDVIFVTMFYRLLSIWLPLPLVIGTVQNAVRMVGFKNGSS